MRITSSEEIKMVYHSFKDKIKKLIEQKNLRKATNIAQNLETYLLSISTNTPVSPRQETVTCLNKYVSLLKEACSCNNQSEARLRLGSLDNFYFRELRRN